MTSWSSNFQRAARTSLLNAPGVEAPTLPLVPFQPFPANLANGVRLNPILTWLGPGATSFIVNFGTTNPPPFATTTGLNQYSPGQLLSGQTYFWQIISVNTSGSTPGPIWRFTVQDAPYQSSVYGAATSLAKASKQRWDRVRYNARLLWTPAQGVTSTPPVGLFVDVVNGNDSNNGTFAHPFKTISFGITKLVAGNVNTATLNVRGDPSGGRGFSYNEGLADPQVFGTSWVNKLSIVSYPGETVWMNPLVSGTGNNGFVVYFGSVQQYIEFIGINMDSTSMQFGGVRLAQGTGNDLPHHIRVKNAELIGGAFGGAGTISAGDHNIVGALGSNEFLGLTVHGGGPGGSCGISCTNYCIYLAGPNNLVDGCNLYDSQGSGLQIYNGGGDPATGNIVRNTRIHDISRAGDTRVNGILVAAPGNFIYNNLIYNITYTYTAGNAGIYVDVGDGTPTPGNSIWNNTIANNTTDGINLNNGVISTTIQNNIVFGNSNDVINPTPGSGTTTNNLVGTDPLFVTPYTDLHLKSGSPAIDAGVTISQVTTDFDGNPRPDAVGTNPDIGAYEHVGA